MQWMTGFFGEYKNKRSSDTEAREHKQRHPPAKAGDLHSLLRLSPNCAKVS